MAADRSLAKAAGGSELSTSTRMTSGLVGMLIELFESKTTVPHRSVQYCLGADGGLYTASRRQRANVRAA